jgi:hypothetical protein
MASNLGCSQLSCQLTKSSARVALTRGPQVWEAEESPFVKSVARIRLVETVID